MGFLALKKRDLGRGKSLEEPNLMIAPRSSVRSFALSLAAALALTGFGLSAGASLAQPMGYGGPPGPGHGRSAGAEAGDLQRLHAALHITAAQEDAWRAFVAASGPDPQQQARERSAQAMLPKLTSPQRVDLAIAAMQADLDTMRQRGEALKAFYATLTPDQQKIFDRESLRQQQGYED